MVNLKRRFALLFTFLFIFVNSTTIFANTEQNNINSTSYYSYDVEKETIYNLTEEEFNEYVIYSQRQRNILPNLVLISVQNSKTKAVVSFTNLAVDRLDFLTGYIYAYNSGGVMLASQYVNDELIGAGRTVKYTVWPTGGYTIDGGAISILAGDGKVVNGGTFYF